MSTQGQVVMLATYNEWMNTRLYDTAARLTPAELAQDRGAFFGSIIGTLNHLVVGDTIWLKRFAQHPAKPTALDPVRALPDPKALNEILFTDLAALKVRRNLIDAAILAWAGGITEAHLAHVFDYTNTRGVRSTKRFGSLVMHFFNHQTHHRGQASTLLFQAGQDIGATDLLVLIPNETEA